jgi:hypothetical protein
MTSVDSHPAWSKLDWEEKMVLEFLPIHGSEAACAKAIGRDGAWWKNRKRKPWLRELVRLRRLSPRGSIPAFADEVRLRAEMMLTLIMELEMDQKVRAMAARALKRRV